MGIDDLSIRRTDEGYFVLVHTDKAQRVETEKHRSVDLDEIVERLLDGHENSLKVKPSRDYGPILSLIRNLSGKYPCLEAEIFPVNWTDPLELYGCLREELIRLEIDLDRERKQLADWVFQRGPEWVWKNRLRVVAEKVVMREF